MLDDFAFEHSFDLLSLQEVDVNALSAPGFVAEWRGKGCTAVLSPLDAATRSHRVALVSRVPCRRVKLDGVQASSRFAAGLIEAQSRDQLEHVLIVAVYGFAGDEPATDVFMQELFQAIDRFGGKFLILGDFNTTQHRGTVDRARPPCLFATSVLACLTHRTLSWTCLKLLSNGVVSCTINWRLKRSKLPLTDGGRDCRVTVWRPRHG